MNQIKRIPRPIGTTELSILYNRTLEEDYHKDLYERTIHHYLRNNFSYCGIYYNIEQFSKIIGVSELDVMKYVTSYGKELGDLNKEMLQGDMVRALTNLSFNWCLEDRSHALRQVAILQSSQGADYKPFVSGELTKAIKTGMDANNQMQSLLRIMMPSGGGALLPYEDPNPTNEKAVTVDQVIRLLKEEKVTPLKEDEDHKQMLNEYYDITNMPEVNALRQVNMDTSKEGLGLMDITSIKDGQVIGHENRREEEFEIDMDQDEI